MAAHFPKLVDPTAKALKHIAKRFNIHLRLAREMYRDGYLRRYPNISAALVNGGNDSSNSRDISSICWYYGISNEKLSRMYKSGYVNLDGIDLQRTVTRYLQRHSGQLSIILLCHLAYDEVHPGVSKIKAQASYDCLTALKINGKLNPPKELEVDLDAACKGQPDALERVARWVRDLIESTGQAHRWAFYGVRLALVEGCYDLRDRPVPKLRKWSNRRKLAKLLREHHLLRGCVTPVAKPGRNSDYFYMFHRPGEFWDL